jgi:predicted nucleic-acid-binding protein
MAALDTNVLVRFVVQDDGAQTASARKLIRNSLSAGESLFVPITVALELEWVLRSSFGFGKPAVSQTLSGLLSTFELRFESEGALEVALKHYGDGVADFTDCMHAALAGQAGEQPFWTFDKAAANVEDAKLLTA